MGGTLSPFKSPTQNLPPSLSIGRNPKWNWEALKSQNSGLGCWEAGGGGGDQRASWKKRMPTYLLTRSFLLFFLASFFPSCQYFDWIIRKPKFELNPFNNQLFYNALVSDRDCLLLKATCLFPMQAHSKIYHYFNILITILLSITSQESQN